jgi:hypothetical protein
VGGVSEVKHGLGFTLGGHLLPKLLTPWALLPYTKKKIIIIIN